MYWAGCWRRIIEIFGDTEAQINALKKDLVNNFMIGITERVAVSPVGSNRYCIWGQGLRKVLVASRVMEIGNDTLR